jgi:uncharacterized phage protein gp47/JayE
LNITLNELVERIEFGIKRLQDETISANEQSQILRAIASISRKRHEQINEQLKLEEVHG